MTLLVATADFLFRTRISETARAAGKSAETAMSASALFEALRRERPSAIFLDLNSAPLDPLESLRTIRASGDLEGVPVVAFYEHVRQELANEAEAIGCTAILTRGQFTARLKDLISTYA